MTRSVHEANREISTVRDMPQGLARIQAAEQQVHLVEAEGPQEATAFALWVLVEAYVWGGEVDKSFVAFTRLLRLWDAHPELFDDSDRHSLFWSFKWMVSSLTEFPTVSADQIDRTLADMERRYRILGEGMDAVALERFEWARARGTADAEDAFGAWRRSARDPYSHCAACIPSIQAAWYIETGRLEEGVRLIESTLPDKPRCGTEPASMLTALAEAYLDLGRVADCVTAYRTATAEMPRAESDMAEPRGRMVRLLARAGHPDRALRTLAADQHLLISAESPGARLAFLLAAGSATHVIRALNETRAVAMPAVPVGTIAELDDWIRSEATGLSRAFDARNGTSRYRDKLEAAWATVDTGVVLPLDVIARAASSGSTGSGATSPVSVAPAADPGPAVTEPGTPDPPEGTHPRTAGEALAAAERLASASNLVDAVPLYLAAASLFEAAGLLIDAGFARAEAAHAAHVLGDESGASQTFAAAIGRLRAGGAATVHVIPVLAAWAQSAVEAGDGEVVLAAAARVDAELRAALDTGSGAGTGTDTDAGASRAAADLLDTRARLLASLDRTAEAAALAEEAADAYTALGAIRDAAHASWLAGRLHDGGRGEGAHRDIERAQRCLEAAVAAFGAAKARTEKGRAAGDLLALLRRTGQDGRADELAAELTRR